MAFDLELSMSFPSFVGVFLPLAQLGIIAVTALGWGAWITRLSAAKARQSVSDRWLCSLTGLCLCILFLENLAYFSLRIAWTAWIALAIGLAGVVVRRRQKRGGQRDLDVGDHKAIWLATMIVVTVQGAGLFSQGADRYYGNGHQDQVNYVQLAQFLIEKPFSLTIADIGLHPWLVKGVDIKEQRIAQSVANAYAAVLTFTDARSAYGATSIVFVALIPGAVWGMLRRCGIPRWHACVGGVWAGLLPAVTKTHLDGFFSQTATLFVFPALAWALLARRQDRRLTYVSVTVLLAFQLNAYTELFVIAAALTVALLMTEIRQRPLQRMAAAAVVVGAAFLVVPAFLPRIAAFLAYQYATAAKLETLAGLAPTAGTWRGWSECFGAIPRLGAAPDAAHRAVVLCGFVIGVCIVAATHSQLFSRRLQLAALASVPTAVLIFLLSAPVLPKYPFAKVLNSATPLFAGLATIGIYRAAALVPMVLTSIRRGGATRSFATRMCAARWTGLAGGFAGLVFAAIGSYPALAQLHDPAHPLLAVLHSPSFRATFADLAAHPERRYLLRERHPIVNAWLAYHGRAAEIYSDVDYVGDRPTGSNQFAFRLLPPDIRSLWSLRAQGIVALADLDAPPELRIKNPQGEERSGDHTFYWVGDAIEIEIYNFASAPIDRALTMRAFAGPANPSPLRRLRFEATEEGRSEVLELNGDGEIALAVRLNPGANLFDLRVEAPTEWLVRVPGDARKHMVRIQDVQLSIGPGP